MSPRLLSIAAVAAFLLAAGGAMAQTARPGDAGHHGHAPHAASASPILPGQDAFGAIRR